MNNNSKDYGMKNRLNLNVVIGLYRSYFRIHRSTQKLIASYNITMPQFGVMEALYHLGDMNIGEIIDRTLSTSGNMTVVIKNLEQEGWITRHTDPADKRAYLVQLTKRGEELIETIFPEHLNDLDGLLDNLDTQEKEHLSYLFKKMNRT
ncbi:MarR family winged helix-turn-helix transcriptional regulator [Pelosinus sp. UFO1]|uniref:MarR family winged helix-turn-helix transcriptional regulator n=1 Tax=Pelosinus sp. UFO1 TaxID=484770 RepID=UPI0004D0E95B|nr:MarR family transcriptional regulator [Pelosinus sp. UFO1]AIF52982.1 transcriptional regulator, MarR family [Pelosinus sp. UFO1]